ncbi:hypothetical protein ACLE20_08080 [Rhizobium sp. YIM 134829]|uniref:hypothetical protein n=1 Tax=Rhizobium sp. YIM 134829 TaxID=3390453 RepID=UPI003978E820
MADFVAVIRRTVDGLSDNSPDMRAKVYEKARGAVRRQLEGMKPRPSDDMINRQMAKLEAAIGEVESAHSAPVFDDPVEEAPAETHFEQPPVPYDVSSAQQQDLHAQEPEREPEHEQVPEPEPEPEPAPIAETTPELPPAPVILSSAVVPDPTPVAPTQADESVVDYDAPATDDEAEEPVAREWPPIPAYGAVAAPAPLVPEPQPEPRETASNAALAAGAAVASTPLAAEAFAQENDDRSADDEPAIEPDQPRDDEAASVFATEEPIHAVGHADPWVEDAAYDENDAEALPADDEPHWAETERHVTVDDDRLSASEPVAMPAADYTFDHPTAIEPVPHETAVAAEPDAPAPMPSAEWELPEWQDSTSAVDPHPAVSAHVETPWTQAVDDDAILDEFEALAGAPAARAHDEVQSDVYAAPASFQPVEPAALDLPPVSGGVTPEGEPSSSWSLDEADPFHQATREAGDASADSTISDWSWPVDRSAVSAAPVEETEDSRRETWDEIDALLSSGAAATAAGAAASSFDSGIPASEPAPVTRPASFRAEPKKSAFSFKRIAVFVVLLLLVGGGGYAYWINRDTMNDWIEDLVASVNTLPPPQSTINPGSAQSGSAASGGTAPATEVASAAPNSKFTQRLQTDGSEVDEGPAQVAGSEAVTAEGKSVAAQTEASRPQETADAGTTAPDFPSATTTGEATNPATTDAAPAATTDAPAATTAPAPDSSTQTAPPDQTTTQMPAGAQKMFLYEERLGQTAPTAIEGGVAWSLKEEAPSEGQRPEPVIQAQISVPDRGLTALMTIKRNADSSLPASHTIEFVFSLPGNFEGGSIDSVQRVALKRTEQDRGDPLIAVPAKITDDFYMIALNDFPEAVTTNLDLLKNRNWIDIPLTYRNGRRALLTLEKGPAGTDAFDKALASWSTARPAGQ